MSEDFEIGALRQTATCLHHGETVLLLQQVRDQMTKTDILLDAVQKRLGEGDIKIARLELRVDTIESRVDDVDVKTLRNIVYGAVGLALVALGGALLALVIRASH